MGYLTSSILLICLLTTPKIGTEQVPGVEIVQLLPLWTMYIPWTMESREPSLALLKLERARDSSGSCLWDELSESWEALIKLDPVEVP